MADLDTIKYRHPPIIEVISEFRFRPDEEWNSAYIDQVQEKVENLFPKKGVLKGIRIEGSVSEKFEQQITVSERTQFLTEDKTAFVQVDRNLLAINHLEPYPTWEKYLPLVKRAYQAFCEVAEPKGIQGIGLRYINRIEFDPGSRKIENYLRFLPHSPFLVEKRVSAFQIATDVVYEDGRDRLRLQLSSVPPGESGKLAVLFDLDYSLEQPGSLALEDAIDWLDQYAHQRVHEAFEACLAEELKHQFQPIENRGQ